MPLLHDQIVARMRSAKLQRSFVPSPGGGRELFSRVAGELSSPPLRAAVGSSLPPSDVTLGLPSARDTVRVYATKLDNQIEKINTAWQTWLKLIISEHKELTEDQAKFDGEWPPFYSSWKVFLDSISSFNPFGPSPSNAWAQIQGFDDQTEAFRARFATFSGAVAPVAATDLGNQPSVLGNVTGSIGNAISSGFKWLLVGGVVLGGVALYLNRPQHSTPL